jgi:hypothetical protein
MGWLVSGGWGATWRAWLWGRLDRLDGGNEKPGPAPSSSADAVRACRPQMACGEPAQCEWEYACLQNEEGQWRCQFPMLGTCSADGSCPNGTRCVHLTDSPDPGFCSVGRIGDPCWTADDCLSGCACKNLRCSSGGHREACETDGDCRTGYCSSGLCQDGRPGDGCGPEKASCQGFCASYGLCTSGELGEPCSFDGECLSNICAYYNNFNKTACVDGQQGSPCYSSFDCWSATCSFEPGDETFGQCE